MLSYSVHLPRLLSCGAASGICSKKEGGILREKKSVIPRTEGARLRESNYLSMYIDLYLSIHLSTYLSIGAASGICGETEGVMRVYSLYRPGYI